MLSIPLDCKINIILLEECGVQLWNCSIWMALGKKASCATEMRIVQPFDIAIEKITGKAVG